MQTPRVSLIAALAANRAIGRGGQLPWHLPPDLARFKRLTLGHTLLMGRKTFDSFGRPLPGRPIVVVTRNPAWPAPPGVSVARTVDEGLAIAAGPEVFVAGGAEIYRAALPRADRLYLTFLEQEFAGDTFFPEVDWKDWRLVEDERHGPGEGAPFPYRFATYERRRERPR
jgi:dihydrofolate reductase